MSWYERANCIGTDPEAFYFEEHQTRMPALVRRICNNCEVRNECLEAGMDEDWGIWGGMTKSERIRIRRQANRVRV
jgi:WhiB family redox-sensing transcriptional regulator